MKLHRVLATAAVTAVIGPIALFVAPAAYATGDTPADGAPPASASPAPASTASPAPASSAPAPSAPATAPETAPEQSADGAIPAAVAVPAAARSAAKLGAEPSPTYTRPTFCSGIPDEERGKTSLRGLPGTIVAGSGWHDFVYRVTNVSTIKVMETDISLYLGTGDPEIDDIAQLGVTVEWFNSATGQWKAIEGEGADVLDNEEFATVKTLAPGEYADAEMRVKVGEKAKAGTGYFFTIGHSYGEDGQCGFDDISQFDFTILASGSEPGKVVDSEGKPGAVEDIKGGDTKGEGVHGEPGGGNQPAPQGGLDAIPLSGSLAETGSSNAMPTTAAIGGAAVVMGAGAVFAVRRRRAGSAA
ncbi:LAETG motif-containing sortase-dependent surface protein [Streptomyces sp. NPDC059883]|uniref:LAETG motif-containing sortase-dependent surface protein n=1 Tax=unclassified Streptomyces TaxID=2593676 RepID=UPI003658B95E